VVEGVEDHQEVAEEAEEDHPEEVDRLVEDRLVVHLAVIP